MKPVCISPTVTDPINAFLNKINEDIGEGKESINLGGWARMMPMSGGVVVRLTAKADQITIRLQQQKFPACTA